LWNGVTTAETERLNKVLHKTGYSGAWSQQDSY
jgi:hypothetical protein